MSKHEHKVAFREDTDCGWMGSITDANSVDRQHEWLGDGERFKFCPDCGESLVAFWQQIDAARYVYRKAAEDREEREEERKRLKREADRAYANASPWLESDLGR